MNQASTRSHCIFTIHVSSREPGSATLRRAKLHLVDLAGYGINNYIYHLILSCFLHSIIHEIFLSRTKTTLNFF